MSLLSSFAGGMLTAQAAQPQGLLTSYGYGPEQMFFIPIPEVVPEEELTPEEIVEASVSPDVGVFSDESDREMVVTPAVGGMGNMGRLGGALGGVGGLLLGGVPLGLLGGLAGTAYDVSQAEQGFMNPYSTPDAGIGSAFLNNMSFGLLGRSADQQLRDQYYADRRENSLEEFWLAQAGLPTPIATQNGMILTTDIYPDQIVNGREDFYGGPVYPTGPQGSPRPVSKPEREQRGGGDSRDRGRPGGGPSGRGTTERGGLGGL